MKKNLLFLLPVLACLIASIASLAFPILIYTYPNGSEVSFNIMGFVRPGMLSEVLKSYTGSFQLYIDRSVATILAVAAILAIIAAFVGVITMSLQRPNTWQFLLAVFGLIGTAIPSILIFAAVLISQNWFPGSFSFGAYPLITPVAMVLCLITVTKKHKKTEAQRQAEEKAKGLIRPAGDL